MVQELVDITQIRAAAQRIMDAVVRTPLLPTLLGDRTRELSVKPENLQPIGAFKIRGALNAVRAFAEQGPLSGVVAYSSGNHAQAVGYAAKLAGLKSVIVIEESAPKRKIDATRAHGAEVVLVDGGVRQETAEKIAAERGYALVPPFDHPEVIAGQGTIGLEIAEDYPDVAAVLVPISGGGLASGIGVAVKALCPAAKVYGVEPELAADTRAAFDAGELVRWPRADRMRTIADGLRSEPSAYTFAHLQATLDGVLTVTEDEIRSAVATLATHTRLVAEPSGAVAPAAFLHHRDLLPAGRTVAVLSGGNLDPATLAELVTAPGRAG